MKIINVNKIKIGKINTIHGFVSNIRNTNNICFLVIEDITGSIQVTILKKENKFNEIIEKLTPSSVITVQGLVKKNENVKLNQVEILPDKIIIETIAQTPLPLDTTSLIDQRLDYRWIDLRSKRNQLIFQVRTAVVNLMRNFLLKKNFIEISSPKLIGAASESGAEVFEINNYFNKKAYLAQSPQFYKQMAIAGGFERVFEVGPVFRAEKSNTSRHATEFTGFDVEIAPVNNVLEVMKLEQDMLVYTITNVKKKYGKIIKDVFGVEINQPKKKFPIVKLPELFIELKKRYNYQQSDQTDLSSEGEKMAARYAKEEYDSDFIFVIEYDKSSRPFYHYRDENQIPQGFDLIYNGVEITSGAKREHRIDILRAQAKEKGVENDIKFYLEFFRYGISPHGGFGMGLDRLVMLILGLGIKEATLCFRGPDRINP